MALDKGNLVLSAVSDLTIATVSVGAVEGGVYLRQEPTFVDVLVDQFFGVWKKVQTDARYFVRFNMAEGSLVNLRNAWNLASGALSGSTLTLDETVQGSVAMVITGVGPDASARTITITEAVSLAATEYLVGHKTEPSIFTVEFEVLAPSTGDFMTIVDV